jgi:hypothetical protein
LRVRLAGKGAGGREARLEELAGATRVAEVLLLAAEVLGVPAAAGAALQLDARKLRFADSLAEAGLPREGGEVEVAMGLAGGMPASCFGFGGQQQTVDELRARVKELEAQVEEENRRHAEAEARWKEDRKKSSEAESHLTVELTRLEASRAGPQAGQLEEWRRHGEAVAQPRAEVQRLRTLSSGTEDPALPGAATAAGGIQPHVVQCAAAQSPERYSEVEEDAELLDRLFKEIDISGNGGVSHAELTSALGMHGMQAELRAVLESLLPTAATAGGGGSAAQGEISRAAFDAAFEKLPRVRGELVSWARGLRLEEPVARVIARSETGRGDIFDGLKGLKALKEAELQAFADRVADEVALALRGVLLVGLRELRSPGGGAGAAKAHVNSKFSLEGGYVGQFATLSDFHRGPEALIGTPNPKVMQGMEAEHCRRENADKQFTTPNYKVTTTPREEWEFVVNPVPGKAYPHTPKDKAQWPAKCGWEGEAGREAEPLEKFMEMEEVKRAGLQRPEVLGLRLYTGPNFILYNARLRGFPAWVVNLLHGNDYETTIFIISSGITKLAKITQLPGNRLVYRGCGGMILPRTFWEDFDECQATIAINAASPEEAETVVQRLKGQCIAPAAPAFAPATANSKAAGTKECAEVSAFDLGSTHLRLDLQGEAATKLLAGKPGVRVV